MTRPSESNGDFGSPLDRPAELVATYGPAAFILCLPLEFTSVYIRQQLSRFVLVLVGVAFLYLLVVRRRNLVIPRSPSVVLLSLYLLASIASWLLTRAPGSTMSLLALVFYPLMGLLLVNVILTEEDHRRAWTAFLVSALAIAALGLVLYVTQTAVWTPNRLVATRLNITFGDPNITARFLTLGACAAILMFAGRKAPAWLCIATAVACAIVLPLTLSRSGLGLFVLTAVLGVAVSVERKRAGAIAAIALIAFVIATGANPTTRQRAEDTVATAISAVTGKPSSFGRAPAGTAHDQNAAEDNRVYLVRAGVAMFTSRPLTGVGFGGYQHALLTTYRNYLPVNLNGANLDTLSHAALVTVMAEQGVIGAVLFVAFLLALGLEAWRARRLAGPWSPWVTIPATLIVPIFIYSQIEGRFITEPYFWLSLGLLYSACARQRQAAVAVKSLRAAPSRRGRVELA